MNNVRILATCKDASLLPYATLVFKTIRVGFPNADILVTVNCHNEVWANEIIKEAHTAGCRVEHENIPFWAHHKWIHPILFRETDPFWICDTDICFYSKVEDWKFDGPMAGAYMEEFNDEFSAAVTRSRLHTSLLWINPNEVHKLSGRWVAKHPETEFTPTVDLIDPVILPLNGKSYFYDTMSLMYHAIGGTKFTPEQRDAYFHFHFGTCSNVILPHLTEFPEQWVKGRQAVLDNPALGKGAWRTQEQYIQRRQFIQDGEDVITPIEGKDGQEAKKWNMALCIGNESAMSFCDLWYKYCHAIDDLIDTMRDGRPRMSKDQIISTFFNACLLYNSEFYIKNRDLLAPIVMMVTNTYRDSVAWEQSPRDHLRIMADVFRTCGNELFIMVALICGGEIHMRQMSMAIKEKDYVLQHE